jgi:hypothetical protein
MLKVLNLTILIPWTKLEPGQSFFIPCLDRKAHSKTLQKEADRLGIEVIIKQVVEDGKYGLRIWRVK